MKCSLLYMSAYNGNTFKVELANGKEVTCHCAYPSRDWDKLYNYLMSDFDIGIISENADGSLNVEVK